MVKEDEDNVKEEKTSKVLNMLKKKDNGDKKNNNDGYDFDFNKDSDINKAFDELFRQMDVYGKRLTQNRKTIYDLQSLEESKHTKENMFTKKRLRFVEILRNSEKKFNGLLKRLVELYVTPVEEHELLSPEDANDLFGNIKDLTKISGQFLDALEAGMYMWNDESKIAHVFSDFVPKFDEIYVVYVKDLEVSLKLYDRLMEDKKYVQFQQLVSVIDNMPAQRLMQKSLKKLLSEPKHRMEKYREALESLQAVTPKTHGGYPYIVENLHEISQLEKKHLEIVGKAEKKALIELNLQFLNKQFDLCEGDDADGRHIIRRDEFMVKIGNKQNGIESSVWAFLLNDMIIFATHNKKGYTCHLILYLYDEILVNDDIKETDGVIMGEDSVAQLAHGWKLSNSKKGIILFAKKKDIKDSWIADFRKSRKKEKKKKKKRKIIADIWRPSEASTCSCCARTFQLFNRKQTCSDCNWSVCSDCSTKVSEKGKKSRKCLLCKQKTVITQHKRAKRARSRKRI